MNYGRGPAHKRKKRGKKGKSSTMRFLHFHRINITAVPSSYASFFPFLRSGEQSLVLRSSRNGLIMTEGRIPSAFSKPFLFLWGSLKNWPLRANYVGEKWPWKKGDVRGKGCYLLPQWKPPFILLRTMGQCDLDLYQICSFSLFLTLSPGKFRSHAQGEKKEEGRGKLELLKVCY